MFDDFCKDFYFVNFWDTHIDIQDMGSMFGLVNGFTYDVVHFARPEGFFHLGLACGVEPFADDSNITIQHMGSGGRGYGGDGLYLSFAYLDLVCDFPQFPDELRRCSAAASYNTYAFFYQFSNF